MFFDLLNNMLNNMLNSINTYEDRKIVRYEDETIGLLVDTCAVFDSDEPYETGVRHPAYHNGIIIIVEMYKDKQAAIEGHEKWIKIMTAPKIPAHLVEVGTSDIAKVCNIVDVETVYEHE